jgi:hypothetical protein
MLSYWVSFLAYPNLFGIKGFVVVVVKDKIKTNERQKEINTHYLNKTLVSKILSLVSSQLFKPCLFLLPHKLEHLQ